MQSGCDVWGLSNGRKAWVKWQVWILCFVHWWKQMNGKVHKKFMRNLIEGLTICEQPAFVLWECTKVVTSFPFLLEFSLVFVKY